MPARISTAEFVDLFGLVEPARAPERTPPPVVFPTRLLIPAHTSGLKLNEEQAISAQLYHALVAEDAAGRLKAVCTCIANELPIPAFTEQLRVAAVKIAQKRRAMGVIPGAADWVFLWRGGSGFIELKTPGGQVRLRQVKRVSGPKLHPVKTQPGIQSDDQKAFQAWCERLEVPYVVRTNVQDSIATLQEWGAIDHK